MRRKKIGILGSTGSIGTQTLEIIKNYTELFSVEALSAGNNAELLIKQALEFNPNAVVIADKNKYRYVADILQPKGIKVYTGEESVNKFCDVAEMDLIVHGITGFAGFSPTYYAILAGKDIALANKESLVVGNEMIMKLAQKHKVAILPVDSEHSAIFQCIQGESLNMIERIILTASGGPFRNSSHIDLKNVTPEMALKHPTWNMGAKITIDSASLMNKGFEIIEAKLLFDIDVSKIDVVVHPQSIIHSMVEFEDGSIKAQMGYPSMRIPIQYAITYPYRIKSDSISFNFNNLTGLTFEQVDNNKFPCINLAREACNIGGSMTAVLNAANEVAVYAFLDNKIKFTDIPKIIEKAMESHTVISDPSYDDLIAINEEIKSKFSNTDFIDS
ncbi:MAG: 1-deoxy-D-xylulose-5-phosphate reductoisomerase [Bacteroidales bacterium]|jgi:1-deoxy-D-xylulose-5-phosphate reductoisomerase|nr:1-deoxy-D-xylulose-5-phosphate reductoisomerase [Bacteroidales bacterium]